MRAHWQYLKYVLRHKWFVFVWCLRLKVPLHLGIFHDWTKFTPAEWNGYVHSFYNTDGSKKSAKDYKPDEVKTAFLRSWQHHESHNKHHWGYWLTFEMSNPKRYAIQSHCDGYPLVLYDRVEQSFFIDEIADDTTAFVGGKNVIYDLLKQVSDRLNQDSCVVALKMPDVYVREMVADWCGAGMAITGKVETRKWYEANKDKMILHPRTREYVEQLLKELDLP